MKNPSVSIIIPTKNSHKYLDSCLTSIVSQTYKEIEVILVDGDSRDNTIKIARKHRVKIYQYIPRVKKGSFDAPHKRNYGIKKSEGKYVYYVDADMQLEKNVIKECVLECEKKFDAVIINEDSVGEGVWAQAKNLERRCYWGDDSIEAPRFFKKSVWRKLGGLDEALGGGGEDWDFHEKLKDKGYKITRIKSVVIHHEGNLQLKQLLKKRYMYGKDSLKYISKRPKAGFISYFPIRKAYIKNWKSFVKRPVDSFFFLIMRTGEYSAGLLGILTRIVSR